MKNCSSKTDGLRVLLYSHDTVGLGHTRRNQAIACCLAESLKSPSILMVSGARESTLFDIPDCVDYVTVPSMKKANGKYVSRSSSLDTARLISLRSELLLSVAENFRPDVLVVDKVPTGVYGELEPALKHLNAVGETKCVLGLRDILDDAESVKREWETENYNSWIEDYYDAVWIYGDQRICDHAIEYEYAKSWQPRMRYVGYIDRTTFGHSHPISLRAIGIPDFGDKKVVVCMVGGGEDGGHVATTFARTVFPADTCGVIVTGPFMSVACRDEIDRLASDRPNLSVVDFLKRPEELLSRADAVVAMCGYNTTCELLALQKPALIVPRVTPRTEQLIRASRLHELGLVTMVLPDSFTSHTVADWLSRPLQQPHGVRSAIDLNGMRKLPQMIADLLNEKKRDPVPARRRTLLEGQIA